MSTSLEESARLAGAHRWAESRLFEILGGWVASTDELDARLMLDRHSHHCAWRAGQWWDRLPILADVDRSALCVAPGEMAERAADHLARVEGTVARLAVVYRSALPRLWSAYERHRSQAGPVADGSALRTLGMVLPDVAADWREGEMLLQQMLEGPEDVGEVARAVAAYEEILTTGA